MRPLSDRQRRRRAKDLAAAWTIKAVGGRRNDLDAAAAEKFLGPDAWALLLVKFASWDGFSRAYEIATAVRKNGCSDATTFESQLRESFRALLLEAPDSYQPNAPGKTET